MTSMFDTHPPLIYVIIFYVIMKLGFEICTHPPFMTMSSKFTVFLCASLNDFLFDLYSYRLLKKSQGKFKWLWFNLQYEDSNFEHFYFKLLRLKFYLFQLSEMLIDPRLISIIDLIESPIDDLTSLLEPFDQKQKALCM